MHIIPNYHPFTPVQIICEFCFCWVSVVNLRYNHEHNYFELPILSVSPCPSSSTPDLPAYIGCVPFGRGKERKWERERGRSKEKRGENERREG